MSQTKSAFIRSMILLGIKIGAFSLTGSAVLLAALVDSMVDVVASLIAYVVKPREHHEEHQLALIQSSWIIMGGILVLIESIRTIHEPVDLAGAGVVILLVTLLIDGSIVRKLTDPSPVVQGLKEDIKADMTNSAGGLVTLTLIVLGFPAMIDKLGAIVISVFLIIKGLKLFSSNMEEASKDHQAEHKLGEGGVAHSHDGVR